MSFISCGVMPCLPVILTEDWGPDRLQYRPGCADHALQCQDLPEPQDQAYVSGLHVEIFDSQLGQQVWNCVKANNGLNCVNWFLKFSFVVWNCVFVNAKDQHVVSLGGQVRVKWLVAQRNSQLGLTCHEWAFMIVEKTLMSYSISKIISSTCQEALVLQVKKSLMPVHLGGEMHN